MHKKDDTMDQIGGQPLPGTGGDFIDTQDVEGHRAHAVKAVEDEVGPDGQQRLTKYSGQEDVEGHRAHAVKAVEDEVGPDGQQRLTKYSEDQDVEGHRVHTQKAVDVEPDGLYRGGPTTQGEVIKRGPGENPHGDR